MTEEEKVFRDKIDRVELEELMYDEFYELIAEAIKIGKAKGHKEALRWRDPKEKLPNEGESVIVKYRTAKDVEKHGIGKYFNLLLGYHWAIHWVIEGSTSRNVIGWRPIE